MSSKDCEEWEAKCKQYRAENKIHLETFKKYLINQNLSKKTIQKHIGNADLYINEYLLYYDAVSMENGVNDTFGFVSFYIRKCSSAPSSLKTTLASLKKILSMYVEIWKN